MRILTPEEVIDSRSFLEVAIETALQSPCKKSQRGIVIVQRGEIVSAAYNTPPKWFGCAPEYCRVSCRDYTIHAEENAIFKALSQGKGEQIKNARMYHVKVKTEVNEIVEGPSCGRCSAFMVHAGIGEMVLREKEGYKLYEAREFHRRSLRK